MAERWRGRVSECTSERRENKAIPSFLPPSSLPSLACPFLSSSLSLSFILWPAHSAAAPLPSLLPLTSTEMKMRTMYVSHHNILLHKKDVLLHGFLADFLEVVNGTIRGDGEGRVCLESSTTNTYSTPLPSFISRLYLTKISYSSNRHLVSRGAADVENREHLIFDSWSYAM